MGIENRDYMMGSGYGGRSMYSGQRWSMVTKLIVVNVVVFLVQALTTPQGHSGLLDSWFSLNANDVLRGQIWRLTTYDFLHDVQSSFPGHLIFNMLLLYMAGRRVEDRYGSGEFLAFYLLAGVMAGIVSVIGEVIAPSGEPIIGASGAAFAVLVVYAMHWPQTIWYFWGIIPVPVILLVLISAGMDIIPILQRIGGVVNPQDKVAHAAHLGGMLFGVLYVLVDRPITDLFSDWDSRSFRRTFQRRPKLKMHIPDDIDYDDDLDDFDPFDDHESNEIPEEVEARLDRLLAKISAEGEASLTDEERLFLYETSRRYRNRR